MSATEQVFRVTSYEVVAGQFPGTSFKLFLEHELSVNYFVMVRHAGSGVSGHQQFMVAVTGDPSGTGDLAESGGNWLTLEREGTPIVDWVGSVDVVECLADEDASGFRLLGVLRTACADFPATGTQTTTDTLTTPWSDISRIVLASGPYGGGCVSSTAIANSDGPTAGARVYPSSTNTINIEREAVATTSVESADFITYVLEFGHEWTVQRVTVSGVAGGPNIDDVSEYDSTALLQSVIRANTWVYVPGGGVAAQDGRGDGFTGNVPALGDGVTQLTTESEVSLGSYFTFQKSAEVYVLSHHQLTAFWTFKPFGDSGVVTFNHVINAPVAAEAYGNTYDGVARTKGSRFVDQRTALSSTSFNLAAALFTARATGELTATATRGDSGSASWAAWVQVTDFGAITLKASKEKAFRITTYNLAGSDFAATTLDLQLIEDLSTNYFVMVRGNDDSTPISPNTSSVRVTSDPNGTGDLAVSSGANVIGLTRLAGTGDWVGTVTVVECLRGFDSDGFRLIDVSAVSMPAYSGTDTQLVTDTANATWGDVSRVAVFAGPRGGGTTTAGAVNAEHPDRGVAAYPKDNDQLVLLRTRGTSALGAATVTAYVVEWGSKWSLQTALITARSDNTYQVNVPLNTAVNPARTWLWAGNSAFGETPDDDWGAVIWHLGDGTSQGATESQISFALETEESIVSTAVLLTHPDIFVDWVSQASTASQDLDLTVDDAVGGESYDALNGVDYTSGQRFGMIYTTATAATAGQQSSSAVVGRHTGKGTFNATRPGAVGNWYGWIQSVDLSCVQVQTSGLNPDAAITPGPVQYMVLQDPHWKQFENVASVTSEGGRFAGPGVSDDSNTGALVVYQEGDPTSDDEYSYRTQRGGSPDNTGTFSWRTTLEADTLYRGHNALTYLMRSQSVQTADTMYANTTVYSTVFKRLVVMYFSAIRTVTIWYRDIDGNFDSWVSTTATVGADCVFEDDAGFDAVELADGRLLFSYKSEEDTGNFNIHVYQSEDGGLTWTVMHARLLSDIRDVYAISTTAGFGAIKMASSGDWVRIVELSASSRDATNTLYTEVSPDRGSSWEILEDDSGVSFLDLGTNYKENWGHWPFDVVGVGDPSGTMLLVHAKNGAANLRFAFAQRDEAWVTDTDLTIDLSAGVGGLNVRITQILATRSHDYIWVFVFLESDSNQGIRAIIIDPENTRLASSQKDLGNIGAFDGAMRYMPHLGRAVWAGHTMILSGGVNDANVATPTDPTAAGHWMLAMGGWDLNAIQRSARDRLPNYFRGTTITADHRTTATGWHSAIGAPAAGTTSDPSTLWTRVTAGTFSQNWNSDRQQVEVTDAAGVLYYQLDQGTPGNPADSWGDVDGSQSQGTGTAFSFLFEIPAERTIPSSGEDIGVRIRPYTSVAVAVADFTVRLGRTEVTVFDNVAVGQSGATISTTLLQGKCEVRLSFRKIGVASHTVDIQIRAYNGAKNGDAWTVQETRTVSNGGAQTSQQIRVGILAAAAAATSTFNMSDIKIGYRSALFQEFSAETVPDDLVGYPSSKFGIAIANGIRARWGGSGAPEGQLYTGELDYTRGRQNLLFDSPRYLWESSSLVEQNLSFIANPATSASRWAMDCLLIVGTEDRTCTLQFANVTTGAAFPTTAPDAEIELSADLFTDLTVLQVDGAMLQMSGDSLPQQGESVNAFLRIIGGTADGQTFKVYNDVRSGWFHVADAVDLAAAGVQRGNLAVIFADRMVWRGDAFQQYSHFNLKFPDVSAVGARGTDSGKHRLGALVPGFCVEMDVPMDWTFRDSEQPNVTEQRTRSGIQWVNEEGPNQRIFEGRIVGDVNRFREKLRDLIGKFHGYNVRPIGFVLDSKQSGKAYVVYGRWQAGSQQDQAAWYRNGEIEGAVPTIRGDWKTAGDADLVIVEDV